MQFGTTPDFLQPRRIGIERRRKQLSPLGSAASRARRVEYVLLVMFIAGLASSTLGSCGALKNTNRSKQSTTPAKSDSSVTLLDSANAEPADTTKGYFASQVDSLTDKVGSFLKSLLPPKQDTVKGEVVLTPPKPDYRNPAVSDELPANDRYLGTPVKRRVEFDSVGNATLHDDFLGGDVSTPLTYSFQDYLHQRRETAIDQGFRKSIQYSTDTSKLSESVPNLLGDYNNITIPIPPSIVPTIFGKPSINLRVSGDVALHLAYRDNEFLATTGAQFSGSETGIDFKQEINVSTNGTIGDKLKIGADWGSERSFQFENLLKLGYTGYPDEILQSIEAGNVNLTTPSQYIGTQQALFGLKAVSRFGPAYVTTLVAQKKGERQSKNFGGGTGGTTNIEHVIQPLNYRRNAYFLDSIFIGKFERLYSTFPRNENAVRDNNTIQSRLTVDVWRLTKNTTDVRRRQAVTFYNLPPRDPSTGYPSAFKTSNTGQDNNGYFVKLDTNQYSVDEIAGVLTLSQEPGLEDVIAVSYRNVGGDQIGDPADAQGLLTLKLIKSYKLYNKDRDSAWKLMLKNTYYVGGAGFDTKSFNVRVTYTRPTGEQVEVMQSSTGFLKSISVMGLDRYNNSRPQDRTPDGLFDLFGNESMSALLDRRTGTITFPYLEPFGSRVEQYYTQEAARNNKVKFDNSFYFPELYNTSQDLLRNGPLSAKNNQLAINVKFAGGVSSTLNLNAFNIVDGSVRVNIGGNQLKENQDYRVDYMSGTITLLRPDLINTGQVSVDYETHDIFTNATKNVLGARAEVPIIDHGVIGVSFMNYSMHLPSLKTRQGEEPLSNWILGFDGNYKVNAPIITDMLNFLPIFNLKEKSELNVRADMALSLPNPNTQRSPIPDDNGASIAYLDDFEGGKNSFTLSSRYGGWSPSSVPVDSQYISLYPDPATRDSLLVFHKAKTNWYEKYPQDVAITEIHPNKSTARPGDAAQVLDVVFDPHTPGIYNRTLSLPSPEMTWGALTQYESGLNVQATNADAIELWMKIEQDGGDPFNGKIKFDIGAINEDIIPDHRLETEDRNGNNRYDPDEDVGLDTLQNSDELGSFPDAPNRNDPSNDNYTYDANRSGDYTGINGQEGNKDDRSSGLTPDTEDLDKNGAVNLDNDYFEYEIPLRVVNNPYIIGQGNNGWYQYRIPLADFKRAIGNADQTFSNISYYRLLFNGFSQPVHVRLNDISIVGSQWTRGDGSSAGRPSNDDQTFRIGYVNIEDNASAPTFYKEPPGAQRDRLAGQTNFVLGNEQSLNLMLHGVPRGEKRDATRIFPSPHDIFNYRSMAIFVHGDEKMRESINSPADTNNAAWVYVRFGTNQFNYYEYRRPLRKDWQNIHVDFGKLTSLKASKSDPTARVTASAEDGVPGATYTVVGSPTLTNAPIFTVGVENETLDSLTTDVWWDELRLLDANDKTDYAMNASTQLKLAEFGRITASIVNERPDFHRVDERFNPTRNLNYNWNVTGEFAMQKTFPKWLENQSVLPLTVSHSETILRPKYLPNTDVEIEGAIDRINARVAANEMSQAQGTRLADSIRGVSETVSIKNSIGASGVKLVFPGSFFLLQSFLNRLTYGFGYGEEDAHSPQYEYSRAWSWTGSIAYDLPTLPNLSLSPWTWWGQNTFIIGRYSDWKINFLPQRAQFAVSATRGRTHQLNRISTLQFPPFATSEDTIEIQRGRVPFINRVFTATRGMQTDWKFTEGGLLSPSISYGLDVTSNLGQYEVESRYGRAGVDADPRLSDSAYYYQRDFREMLKDIFFKNGALVRPGQDALTTQRLTLNTNPRLPAFFGLEKLIRPLFSYKVEYRWQDALTNLQNAKQAAWNNTISTGLELNVRDLGVALFGKPIEENAQATTRNRGARGREGQMELPSVEQLPNRSVEERGRPVPKPRDEARNQVTRGEDFRPQGRPNPLGQKPQLLDTLNRRTVQQDVDSFTSIYHEPGVGTGGIRDREYVSDTLLIPTPPYVPPAEVAEEEQEPPITLKEIAQKVIQKPLFDWNGTKFNFTQTNTSLNTALMGDGSGITNFLARGIFAPEFDQNGPSRAYQLGLITDPHGRLLVHWVPRFPFVEFDVRHGDRAPSITGRGMDITDIFTQQNNFDLATSRPLWEGANLSLNWKVQFSYEQRNTLRLDALGFDSLLYLAKAGEISRSFLSIPQVPFLKFLQSGIEKVGSKYREKRDAAMADAGVSSFDSLPARVRNDLQQKAFMEGFETIPMFSGFLREFLPRLNYSFNWNGLEKFPLFSFADHANFRHGYNGNYRRQYRMNPGEGDKLTTLQTIVYGFRPLIALDLTWDKFYDGRMTASTNYDTQTEWGSDYSSQHITKRLSTTIGITANYQRQGLAIPFLKLNLKNEFGASFTFSKTISGDSYYTFENIDENPDGISNGGLEKTTIEPRISYTVSQQLTLEGFYRYEKTVPSASGQLSPPTRLIMAGVDIRLKIQ